MLLKVLFKKMLRLKEFDLFKRLLDFFYERKKKLYNYLRVVGFEGKLNVKDLCSSSSSL